MQAPQHSVTAPIVFIPSTDPAWDAPRINREIKALKDGQTHPMVEYWRGRTRFDLAAPSPVGDALLTPRDYLKPDVKPGEWKLRRLRIGELARCEDLGGKLGQLEAFRLSCASAPDGATFEDPLTPSRVDELAEAYGGDVLFEVGEAAMLASGKPTQAEKKP